MPEKPLQGELMPKPESSPVRLENRPMVKATISLLGKTVRAVCDPVLKVCYPLVEKHWYDRYKNRFSRHAGKIFFFDLFLLCILGAAIVVALYATLVLPRTIPKTDLVTFSLEPPMRTTNDSSFPVSIHYQNDSSEELVCAVLTVRFSVPFTALQPPTPPPPGCSTLPATTKNAITIGIGTIPARGQGDIRVLGKLSAQNKSLVGVEGTLQFWKTGEAAPTSVIRRTQITLQGVPQINTLTIESSFPPNVSALIPGKEYPITIRYTNNTGQTVTNVRLTPEWSNQYVEKPRVPPEWNSQNTPALAALPPGASATLSTTVQVKANIDSALFGSDTAAFFRMQILGQFDQGVTRGVVTRSVSTNLPIASTLQIRALTVFTSPDGEQLGDGPLPPRVGENTTYPVVLTLQNGSNALQNAEVEAYLGPNVSWTGKTSVTSGNSIDYLPLSGKIRWQIGTIPEYAGTTEKVISATVFLRLRPQSADAGTSPVLLKKITVSALDSVAGVTLRASSTDATTVLSGIPLQNSSQNVVTR